MMIPSGLNLPVLNACKHTMQFTIVYVYNGFHPPAVNICVCAHLKRRKRVNDIVLYIYEYCWHLETSFSNRRFEHMVYLERVFYKDNVCISELGSSNINQQYSLNKLRLKEMMQLSMQASWQHYYKRLWQHFTQSNAS